MRIKTKFIYMYNIQASRTVSRLKVQTLELTNEKSLHGHVLCTVHVYFVKK